VEDGRGWCGPAVLCSSAGFCCWWERVSCSRACAGSGIRAPAFRRTAVLTTGSTGAAGTTRSAPRIFKTSDRSPPNERRLESAALVRIAPFSYRSYSRLPSQSTVMRPRPARQPTVDYNEVGPAYLATMGIPLVSAATLRRAEQRNGSASRDVNEQCGPYWRGRIRPGGVLQ